jgi:hypothetical protein
LRILDVLLGRDRPKQSRLDQLFALPGAAVSLDAALGFRPCGRAAVAFRPASGQSFMAADKELGQLLALSVKESGSQVQTEDDRYGYRWVTVSDPDLEDLIGSMHVVNSTLEDHGFGPQLLCSVFGFADGDGARLALVYLYKRGTFYPFAPIVGERRNSQLELRVRGSLKDELPIESDLSRWFALWGVPVFS